MPLFENIRIKMIAANPRVDIGGRMRKAGTFIISSASNVTMLATDK